MKKIVTLTGEKNTKKDLLAMRLAENSNVEYVKPYSTVDDDYFHHVSKDAMRKLLETEETLLVQYIEGEVYAFLKKQFTADYSVIIIDDFGLINLKSEWKGKLYTVKVVNKHSLPSKRVGVYLYDHEFDTVFDYDTDDIHELEYLIE